MYDIMHISFPIVDSGLSHLLWSTRVLSTVTRALALSGSCASARGAAVAAAVVHVACHGASGLQYNSTPAFLQLQVLSAVTAAGIAMVIMSDLPLQLQY